MPVFLCFDGKDAVQDGTNTGESSVTSTKLNKHGLVLLR